MPSINMNGASYVVDVDTSNAVMPSLEIHDIELDWNEIENTKNLLKREGKDVYLNTLAGTTENLTRRTVLFRTMNTCAKNGIRSHR